MTIAVLRDVGLTDGEAKVYEALLEVGPASNSQLARRTGLQSSSVYYCLNALSEKGFATFVTIGRARRYQAVNPREVLEVLGRQREEIEGKLKRFGETVPELEKLKLKSAERNEAFVYEGLAGVRAAFNEVLRVMKPGEEYDVLNLGDEYAKYPEAVRFFRSYHSKRAKLGVNIKIISSPRLRPFVRQIFKGLKHTRTRFLEQDTPTGILIFKDRVQTIIWEKKPVVFVIRSQLNADRYRRFFEHLWANAKP